MKVVEIDKLSKVYPTFTLKELSFTLESGKIYGLLGKNGAGKSTLLKSMLNLVPINTGKITISGLDLVENEGILKERVGIALGNANFYPEKKLKTVAHYFSSFYETWQEEDYQKFLKVFQLDEEKKIKNLSVGMKVKFQLTLALAHQSKLFILDEPTSGLDPVARREVLQILKNLAQKRNACILFSTHITTDLEEIADEIIYLRQGRLVVKKSLAEFLEEFCVGESKSNLEEIIYQLEGVNYDF